VSDKSAPPEKSSLADKAPLPIATATIARLYMLQGKLQQAETIYRQLLKESPDDARLVEGLAEVQRRAETAQALSDDRVELRVLGDAFVCNWVISDEGRRRARLVLGGEGQLVLRLASFPSDPGRPSEDRPLAEETGTLVLPLVRATLVAAAVGLRASDGRFTSIAHCTGPSRGKL
jgi:tetratricopeptide (TPR) repeat protein